MEIFKHLLDIGQEADGIGYDDIVELFGKGEGTGIGEDESEGRAVAIFFPCASEGVGAKVDTDASSGNEGGEEVA